MSQLILDKSKKYLLACSFGPDSMALFHMLLSEGYNFEVAHVNYHLREESDSETHGLKIYCEENDVPLHILDYKEKIQGNVEASCRQIRYKFFASLQEEVNYDEVLVAHNEDDLIETYFMQIQRQITPIWWGINAFTVVFDVPVRRPLLIYSKAELMNYCYENKVPFAIDISNYDTSLKRNALRAEVVSKLTLSDRVQILDEIVNKNEQLLNMFNYLTSKVDIHNCEQVLSLSKTEQIYAINLAYQEHYYGHYLSKANVGEIIKVLKSPRGNIMREIKRGVYLIKSYGTYTFIESESSDLDYTYYHYEVKDLCTLDNQYFYFKCDTYDNPKRHYFDQDFPLTIRTLTPDDYVLVGKYTVKARRLFIDWKMPMKLRKRWPCIENCNGEIIYVPRYQKDFKPDPDCDFYVKVD